MTPDRSPSFLTRNRILIVLAALALPALLVTLLRMRSQRQQAAKEEAAIPLPVQVKVAALGRVEPAGGIVNIASPEQGIISRLLVGVGDSVLEGQTLAYLNVYDVRLAERNFAASQLIEAENALTAQEAVGSAQILEADTRVEQVD